LWKTIGLPVETPPEGVDAVDDPVELVPAVGVGGPEVLDRLELGEPGQTVLRRLGHLHLVREEAPVAVARMDPEPFRRLLGEEPRRLIDRCAAEEEARGEADRARAGRDEVRQVPEAAEVHPPALAREQLGERRLPRHERRAAALDPGRDRGHPGVERVVVAVAREEDAAFFEELADGGHPEGERRRVVVAREDRLGLDRAEPTAARPRARRSVGGIDLAAREGVVAAEELHGPLAADHVDLDRLRRAGRRRAHEHDGRGGLRLHRRCDGRGQERASLRLARDAKRGAWGAGGSPRRASPPLARDAKRGVWGAGGSPRRASPRLARDAKRGVWGAGGSPRRASPRLARDATRGVWGAGGAPRRASPRLARDAKRGVWGAGGSPRRASPRLARDATRGVWGAGGSPRRASPRLARDATRGV